MTLETGPGSRGKCVLLCGLRSIMKMQEDERFSFCWLANGCMCLLLHAIAMKTPGKEQEV